MPNYPDPEVWPDDDPDSEPKTKAEIAREELSDEEYADYLRDVRKKRNRW